MFTKACTYAIKSVIFIEANGNKSKDINLNEIAEAIVSPPSHTTKILKKLKKSGLLISTKGIKGRYQIKKNKIITIGQIVNLKEGLSYLSSFILGLKSCSSINSCPAYKTYSKIKEILNKDLLNLYLSEFSVLLKNIKISLKKLTNFIKYEIKLSF